MRESKIIKIYVVYQKDNPDLYLTIAAKKEHCAEFVKKLLTKKNEAHYLNWCSIRDLDPKSNRAIDEYYNKCVDIDEKRSYLLGCKLFKFSDIVSFLRMFAKCPSLNCSYESPMERKFADFIEQEEIILKNFKETLQKTLDEAAKAEEEDRVGEA